MAKLVKTGQTKNQVRCSGLPPTDPHTLSQAYRLLEGTHTPPTPHCLLEFIYDCGVGLCASYT